MNCTDVKRLLHEEPQAGRADEAIRAHLVTCGACQQVHAELEALQQGLADQSVPSLPSGFEFALRSRLMNEAAKQEVRQAATSRRFSRRSAWVAMAAAAALLLASAAVLYVALEPASAPSYHQLELSIRSQQIHEGARVEVQLPAGVELMPEAAAVLGAGKTLRWQSKLARGINSIALPLRKVAGASTAQLKVRLMVGAKSWARDVTLDAGAAAAAGGEHGARLAWVVDLDAEEAVQ